LAREQVLAALFGAGNEMDAFVVAFRIPNLVRDLFAEGAMSAAFVPTFTRHLTLRGKSDAWRLGNNLLNALLLVTGGLVLVAFVFARPLVTLYAKDYGSVPGKLELTVQLTRVMLPFLTLAAVAAAVMGMLNSLHHYFLPALAPATFNVASIACAFLLVPVMPALGVPKITAMAVAVVIGGVGQIALQWPALRREGFRYRPTLDFADAGLRRVLVLMGPGSVGLAATQVNLLINTLLATTQGTGAVSWLQYAFRLMYLPIGLFGVSIATAVLPAVARQAAMQDPEAMRQTVGRGMTLMMIANIPASVGLFVLAPEIIRLLLERGRFLPSDTAATAAALRYYAIGLVGYSAARIASPIFYVLGASRVPVMLSCVSISINIVVSLALVNVLGFRGLALATSLAAIVNGGASLFFLRNRLGGIEGHRLAETFVKISIASLAMATVVGWSVHRVSAIAPARGTGAQALQLLATVVGGLATLTVAAKLLRIAEFDEAVGEAWSRVQKLLNH
jgi:putative peptidoglycan lipid II flippase